MKKARWRGLHVGWLTALGPATTGIAIPVVKRALRGIARDSWKNSASSVQASARPEVPSYRQQGAGKS
jgi:hypothetical protein